MDRESFNEIVESRLEKIKTVLASKGKEYSGNEDVFHNFNNSARRRNITRERALDGFLLKHEVSVGDIINDIENGKLPTREALDEKIGDIINYYILLEGSIIERIEERENEIT